MDSHSQEVITQHYNARPSDEEIRSFVPEPSAAGGRNIKLIATSSNTSYLLKFCRNDQGHVPEICQREELVSLLGKLLGVPVVNAWVCDASLLSSDPVAGDSDVNVLRDRFVVMPLVNGKSVDQNRVGAALRVGMNLSTVGDILAFMHWLGDEDRGVADVMYNRNGLLLIDNGLCGPGDSSTLRGYHPSPEAFDHDQIILKCYPGKPSFIEFLLRDAECDGASFTNPPALDRIKALDDDAIEKVVELTKVNSLVARVLIERKSTIVDDYATWLEEAIALCAAPKRN